MGDCVTINTLVENTVNVAGLRAEHGLSFFASGGREEGAVRYRSNGPFLHNAQRMGLALDDVEAVVLSYGHYDHTGGVEAVCRGCSGAKLCAHPSVLAPKFAANSDGTSRVIG